jgi:hypothetical protein
MSEDGARNVREGRIKLMEVAIRFYWRAFTEITDHYVGTMLVWRSQLRFPAKLSISTLYDRDNCNTAFRTVHI